MISALALTCLQMPSALVDVVIGKNITSLFMQLIDAFLQLN